MSHDMQTSPGRPTILSVVVPVYGDGAGLPELTTRLIAVLSADARAQELELIFVNDGSPAETWAEIGRLARAHTCVRALNLSRNFGQQNALLAGLRIARGDIIVTVDDDLQHPPETVPLLLDRLSEYDLVYGVPVGRVRGFARNLFAGLMKAALSSVFGAKQGRLVSAYRAFRGSLRPVFDRVQSPHVSIDVLLGWATTRIGGVSVQFAERRYGTSGYTLRRLMSLVLSLVTGFSIWPLRLASVLGLLASLFGIFVLAFVLTRYFRDGAPVQGFPFLASIAAIFAGVQLFALGVIGEYVARMYYRLMDRPTYVVAEAINCGRDGRSMWPSEGVADDRAV